MAHEEILAAVDAGRLMDCVRAVCTGERLSNEPEAQAFDVLHKSLEDAGCRVTRESLPGYVSTPEGASFEAGGEAYEVLTHPMTPSVEVLEAPLAYVPVDAVGETAPADVSGRIVLTDGLAMEPVVRALEDRGAAGVVFITGEEIHNIELYPGKGAQLVRAAGVAAQLMAKENGMAQVRLPSGEVRYIRENCKATIGQVGNTDHANIQIGKAGRKRHMGWRPTVRGSVMNPCDHPHGGGEGKAPVGRPGPVTPWGKPALGYKTRKTKNPTDKFIVKRRNVK